MNKKKRRMVRQGDVLVLGANGAKPGAPIPRDRGRAVLADGELTGHQHAISSAEADLFAVTALREALPGDMVLKAKKRVQLRHEEHSTIVITPGTHIVRRQREYRWGSSRRVAD